MQAEDKETFKSSKKDDLSRSKLAMSLDYIFGKGTGKRLDYGRLAYEYSRRTGRLRYVLESESKKTLFTLRPNGTIAPTVEGARMLVGKKIGKKRPRWVVTVIDGVSELVSGGKTVFCRHVADCDKSLRAGEDVVVMNQKGELLAVGKSVVSSQVMKQFKRGVAVKVREGSRKNGASVV